MKSVILIVLSWLFYQSGPSDFYVALASDSLPVLKRELIRLESLAPSSQVLAYKGAMIMRTSAFEKTVKAKIDVFKKGHELLETAIAKDPENVEYRFLRLAVQEHVPGVLKYNKDIDADKAFIIASYSALSEQLQKRIWGYAQKSKILSPSDLK